MNPLANAVLGVLFIGVGVGATTLMYYLRLHGTSQVAGRSSANEPGHRRRG